MKIKEIQKEYEKKIKLINKFNNFYFEKSNPIVSDKEYDELKKEILFLENNYDFLNSKHSPSRLVGHKPSKNFKKVSHKVPMLSLSNAFSEEELIIIPK